MGFNFTEKLKNVQTDTPNDVRRRRTKNFVIIIPSTFRRESKEPKTESYPSWTGMIPNHGCESDDISRKSSLILLFSSLWNQVSPNSIWKKSVWRRIGMRGGYFLLPTKIIFHRKKSHNKEGLIRSIKPKKTF